MAAAIASLGYGVPQILQVAGVLHDPWDRVFIFLPSLILAPCFVAAMAAAHELVAPERRSLSLAAVALSIIYAVLVSGVYVIQLGVVIPHDLRGEGAEVALFACCSYQMPMTAMDLLGYSSMSIATALLGTALKGDAAATGLRRILLIHGWLAVPILGQLAWPALIYVAAVWLVTFPGAMFLLRRRFA